MLSHEHIALSYHLKQNLWLGEFDFMLIDDSVSADLDVAMAVRRAGVQGDPTPRGILTLLSDTSVGKIVSQIERREEPGLVGLGLDLLKLSSDAARNLSLLIDRIATLAAKDGLVHDATLPMPGPSASGITVHSNSLPDLEAAFKLKQHCELRKHSQKAPKWVGMVVKPGTSEIRLGITLEYPWTPNPAMDALLEGVPKPSSLQSMKSSMGLPFVVRKKPRRNERCPCGSGEKYKHCCLDKTDG